MDSRAHYTIHPVAQQVLTVIAETASYHGKKYCYPNQRTLMQSLHLHFGRKMSRRTLCRWMAYLEGNGWIRRQSRHKRGKGGALELHSTLYVLKRLALRFIGNIARRLSQLIDISAVTKVAQSTPTTGGSQPPPRDTTRATAAGGAKKGIAALRAALRR